MLLCDEHDAPAVYEISWIDAPGTADERGASMTACAHPGCLGGRRADIEAMGGEPGDVDELVPAVTLDVAA